MRHRAARSLLLAMLIPAAAAGAHGSHPSYALAPGTPACAAGDPVVCAWTIDGLAPPPVKYAIEALAGYDPACSGTSAFTATFSFTTPDAEPMIAIPAGALETTVCASGDDPCTSPATYHAATVQIRVKALDPPSAPGRAQNNPFSALSAPVAIPGVCAAACPQACRNGIDAFLVQLQTAQDQSGITSSLYCSYDSNWQAGTISYGGYTATGVLPIVQGSALIGVAYCIATIDNADLVDMGLQSAEQAACATQYAPAFSALAGQSCDIAP